MQLKPILTLFLLSCVGAVSAQNLLRWKETTPANIHLPEEIKAYKARGKIDGDTITAYYTSTDISGGNLVFFPLYSEKNKKPEQYFSNSPDDILLMTNGGFFGADVSYSLVMNSTETLAPNIRAVVRPHNNENYTYYPTRSAFGVSAQLQPEATWVYTLPGNDVTYSYPLPAPNTLSALPLPQPSDTFPSGGNIWQVSEAIGGGPLLIKDSTIITNFEPELFYDDIIATKAPRTAIGRTSAGEIINLVVDGRQSHSKGVTLPTLAKILLDLGCTEAINLDGGGSSVMMIGESIVNEPSDGNTRSIPSVVAIKKAQIYDTHNPAHFRLVQPADSVAAGFGPSKSLVLESGNTAFYFLPQLKPAKYRISFYLHDDHSLTETDSLAIFVWRKGIPSDTFLIDQNRYGKGFFIAGEQWLSSQDSLELVNIGAGKKAIVDAVRLIKKASGKPEIDFVPKTYGRLHTKGDTIKLVTQAISKMEERPISRFMVYESDGASKNMFLEKSFDPTTAYLDSFTYVVQKMQGSINLTAYVADVLNDSAGISYTINIDDSPPLIRPGRESVLAGSVGDSLKLILMMEAAKESRPLKAVEIFRSYGAQEERMDSIPVNGLSDTLSYVYVLSEADKNGVTLSAKIKDIAGYSNTWSYRFLPVTNIQSFNKDSYKIWYDERNDILQIDAQKPAPEKYNIIITNISGSILKRSQKSDILPYTLDMKDLTAGFYVITIKSKSGIYSQKFVKVN